MARHKIKPNLDIQKEMNDLINEISEYFGDPYDDRDDYYDPNHRSLRDVSKKFNISVVKARKILITAGKYSTKESRRVQDLYNKGLSIEEICNTIGIARSNVNTYIPYKKIIYNLDNATVNADKQRRYREKRLVR